VGKLTGKLAHLSGIGLNGGLLRWEARERHGSFERCFFPSLHTVGIPTLSRRARKDRPPSVVMILTKSKSYAGRIDLARHRWPTAHARARYRCFLPDLAGLAGVHRAGPMSDRNYSSIQFHRTPQL